MKDNMKKYVWTFIALVGMTGGCAVSEKSPSSNDAVGRSADRWRVITAAKDAAQAQDDEAEADEDFDLLEEEIADQMVEIADPLEPFNRTMYGLNDILYFWVVKPVGEVYTDVAPEPVRIGISNFFQNLTTPVRFVNCLLQGKGDTAGTEFNRFVINTTAGVLGFGDPARDQHGLEPAEEDMGQTLAVFGFDNGFYIVWPLLGPSNTPRWVLPQPGSLTRVHFTSESMKPSSPRLWTRTWQCATYIFNTETNKSKSNLVWTTAIS